MSYILLSNPQGGCGGQFFSLYLCESCTLTVISRTVYQLADFLSDNLAAIFCKYLDFFSDIKRVKYSALLGEFFVKLPWKVKNGKNCLRARSRSSLRSRSSMEWAITGRFYCILWSEFSKYLNRALKVQLFDFSQQELLYKKISAFESTEK